MMSTLPDGVTTCGRYSPFGWPAGLPSRRGAFSWWYIPTSWPERFSARRSWLRRALLLRGMVEHDGAARRLVCRPLAGRVSPHWVGHLVDLRGPSERVGGRERGPGGQPGQVAPFSVGILEVETELNRLALPLEGPVLLDLLPVFLG